MSEKSIRVSISPEEALAMVKSGITGELVHEETHRPCEDKFIGTLIFERYFFRVKNRVALVVISDNFSGETNVRIISTGSSEGILFNIDFGASEGFVGEAEKILKKYEIL